MIKLSPFIATLAFVTASQGATVVLTEPFTYPDGSLVGGTSPWTTHSGNTPGQVNVISNTVNLTSAETEDVNVVFSGSPYTVGKLTANYEVNFSALPTATGTYLAHFKDNTASGFRSRLYASTTGAAAGLFRLGISNSNNSLATTVNVPLDLSTGTTYSITMTWDLDALVSTLSINGGTAVTATDTANNTALSITSFGLRQATGMGTLTMDNLVVSYVPEPTSALLGALGFLAILRRRR